MRANRQIRDRNSYDVLEPRMMLAGNVSASVQGNTLNIHGDGFGNGVQIGEFGDDGYFVRGLYCAGGDTSINGQDIGDFAVFSGFQNINIKTYNGNDCIFVTNDIFLTAECLDFVEFEGEIEPEPEPEPGGGNLFGDIFDPVVISGNLHIKSGNGNDDIVVGGINTGHDIGVWSGDGHDEIGFCDIFVQKNLIVDTNHGKDDVFITGFDFEEVELDEFANFVGYSTIINTGKHNDDVVINSLYINHGALIVETNKGADDVFIGEFFDEEVDGGDLGLFEGVRVGTDLIVNMGHGCDEARVLRTDVGINFITHLGKGANDLLIDEVDVEFSTIITGGCHEDNVVIDELACGVDVIAHLNNGNDTFAMEESIVGANLVVTTGCGADDVFINGVFVDNLTHIITGKGNDDVFVDFLDTDLLFAFLGNGNDDLRIFETNAWQLLANGGNNFDCITAFDNAFSLADVFLFEDFDCDIEV